MKDTKVAERNTIIKRQNPWPRRLTVAGCISLLVLVIFCAVFFPLRSYFSTKITLNTIKKSWATYNYEQVYNQAKAYLEENPYNNSALIYYSYSCFYLSQSQTENQKTQEYLDECINNLRIALYDASKSAKPQIYYMLGRAYFFKNTVSSYYYSDLAIKYLLLARENGFESDDIPEYLGLSYASLGMTLESISSFTEALLIRESDNLLLSIAEQYHKLRENKAAKQYLFRITNNSKNDDIIIGAQNLLAQMLFEEEEYDQAMEVYNKVLEMRPNSVDANYGIGLIYEKQNNIVKARAQWRNTLKVQPNHAGALQKLSEY